MSFGDEHGYGGDPGQTRTRLPDGGRPGEGHGGRRPPRASRSLVTVVGVVVLLVAAIAFANRGGGGHDKAASSGGSGAAGGSAAAPTAPTGVTPVPGKAGPDAIPAGFAHDQQGAASAAANYAVALGSEGMFHTEQRHTIVDTVYTQDAAAKLQGSLDAAYTPAFFQQLGLDTNGDAPEGSVFVSRTIPVGTKVETFAQDAATVSVWYTGLVGMAGTESKNPVSTTWKTSTFHLQWSDKDWKTVSYTQKNGPAPVPGDDAASTAGQISKAVEQFGGFTYAR